jgi:hypothetical protein
VTTAASLAGCMIVAESWAHVILPSVVRYWNVIFCTLVTVESFGFVSVH